MRSSSRTVTDILKRISGTTLSANEAEEITAHLHARVMDSEQRLLELRIRAAIDGYAARAGKLTDEQFQRVLAIIMPRLADNPRAREKDLQRAFRATANPAAYFTGSGPIAGSVPRSKPDGVITNRVDVTTFADGPDRRHYDSDQPAAYANGMRRVRDSPQA